MDQKKNGAIVTDTTTPKRDLNQSKGNNINLTEAISLEVEQTKDVNYLPNNKASITSLSIDDIKQKYLVDLSIPLAAPPRALEVKGKNGLASIGNYGGITLVTAKAKSGKTFATSLFVSALIKGEELQDKLIPSLMPGKDVIQVFDTEQSSYYVQRVGKRIEHVAEKLNTNKLQIFKLRTEPNNIKEQIIEKIIYNTKNLGAVVIDGGKDLIFDINNPEQSTVSTTKVLRWAEELNILIIVILHQNKNDGNARGHVGTEYKNKADVIVNVIKDKENDLYIIEPEDCRDKEFEPFAFKIDQIGNPYIFNDWVQETEKEKRKELTAHQIPEEQHRKILNNIFSKLKPKYDDLINAICNEFEQMGSKFGKTKAKQFKTYYESKGWIEPFKEIGNRYAVYRSTQPG